MVEVVRANTEPYGVRRRRCALFVDFDNVYTGLLRLEPTAAEAFAQDPGRWLARLAHGEDAMGRFRREFLVRSCYLNPATHARFRPFFTRAGFRVVDCPSLTQQGKSSADIHLVLDAVDALAAQTQYDEFLIVSSDADFTPLALRCRESDRRVTIIAAGPAAGAYRAVADSVVSGDELAGFALGADETTESTASGVVERNEGQLGSDNGAETGDRPAASVEKAPSADRDDQTAAAAVRRHLEEADAPVKGAAAAHIAQTVDPTLPVSGWEGHGSFTAWLLHNVPEAGHSPQPAPGYFWDRARLSEADLDGDSGPQLTELQRQVASVTDAPRLDTQQYRHLFVALADDINNRGFSRTETSKRVRDALSEHHVGRGAVNFVIQGLLYAGLLQKTPATPEGLAEAWADNVVGLAQGARMDLDAAAEQEIRAWVSGGLGSE